MPTFALFLLGCCVLSVRSFLPSKESTDGRPDYTHASITQAAIYHATSDVIANVISPGKYNASDPDTTITTYFGNVQILRMVLRFFFNLLIRFLCLSAFECLWMKKKFLFKRSRRTHTFRSDGNGHREQKQLGSENLQRWRLQNNELWTNCTR